MIHLQRASTIYRPDSVTWIPLGNITWLTNWSIDWLNKWPHDWLVVAQDMDHLPWRFSSYVHDGRVSSRYCCETWKFFCNLKQIAWKMVHRTFFIQWIWGERLRYHFLYWFGHLHLGFIYFCFLSCDFISLSLKLLRSKSSRLQVSYRSMYSGFYK